MMFAGCFTADSVPGLCNDIISSPSALLQGWVENSSFDIVPFPQYFVTDENGVARIKIRVHVISVRCIDTVNQSFDCKVVFTYTWHVKKKATFPDQTWVPEPHFINTIGKVIVQDANIKRTSYVDYDEMCYRTVVQGTFAEHFELQQFPIDFQRLHIRSVMWDFPQSIKKPHPTSIDPPLELEFPKRITFVKGLCLVYKESFIEYDTWTIHDSVEVRQGRTMAERNDDGIRYLTLDMFISIERHMGFYLYNVVFPVFLLVLFSFISFFMSEQDLSSRMSITLTLVLTLVALKFVVNQYLPATSNLTYLDKYILTSFFFMSLVAGQNVMVYYLYNNAPDENDTSVELFNKVSGAVITIMWLIVNFGVSLVAVPYFRNLLVSPKEEVYDNDLVEYEIPELRSMRNKRKKTSLAIESPRRISIKKSSVVDSESSFRKSTAVKRMSIEIPTDLTSSQVLPKFQAMTTASSLVDIRMSPSQDASVVI